MKPSTKSKLLDWTANILIVIGISMMILGTLDCKADVLVDDFSDTQSAFSYRQSMVTSDTIEINGSDLYNPTRQIYVYSPLMRDNSSLTLISGNELYINNVVDKNQKSIGLVTIEYKFNNTDFSKYKGVRITSVGMQDTGKVSISTNGPSEQSYSNWHAFNGSNNFCFKSLGIIEIPFKEFKGGKLFNNINNMRVDFKNVALWSGDVTIELIERK